MSMGFTHVTTVHYERKAFGARKRACYLMSSDLNLFWATGRRDGCIAGAVDVWQHGSEAWCACEYEHPGLLELLRSR